MATKTARRPAATPDEREAYLRANQRGFDGLTLPESALDDLRYFEKQARSGRAIRTEALIEWIRTKHQIEIGQSRLHRIARESGITPWWAKK